METILSSKLEVMAYINIDDVKFRKSQLDDKLITLDQLVTTFQQKTRATDELQKTKQHAEDALGELETKGKDADSAAETYDREFLDRSAGSSWRFFQRFGISTLQDWLVMILYVLYLIICITLFIIAVKVSPQKILAGVTILLVSIFFGLMITGLILRFG